jgi:hypothetical protein
MRKILARDDVFAEEQAADDYQYRDGATNVTEAEAEWVQKAFHARKILRRTR